jgi:hypothetical protein
MSDKTQSEIEGIVDTILRDASKILQNNPAHACNVTFRRNGPIETFASPDTPAKIRDAGHGGAADRDAVHREDAEIKIVKEILTCVTDDPVKRAGCSWPPEARDGKISIIVVEEPEGALPNIGRLWAHELGHRMGLRHVTSRQALMTACDFGPDARLNQQDCGCFLRGPLSCNRTNHACPPRK